MDKVFRIVHFHLQFFEDDTLLFLDVRLVEAWIQHQIGQHIERDRQVFIQNFDVVADEFLGSVCVEIPARRISLTSNLLRQSDSWCL